MTVELIAEHAWVQPGQSTRVAVHFQIEEGWHIYAEKPGDAGLPTKIAWSGPPPVSFRRLTWPTPQPLTDPGNIKTFGYRSAVLLSTDLKASPRAIVDQPLPIHAQVEWLACKAICVPGSASLDLSLQVSRETPLPSPDAALFERN